MRNIGQNHIGILYKNDHNHAFFFSLFYLEPMLLFSNFDFCMFSTVLKVHILPREMLGKSTFGLSMWLLKWLPMRLVDRFLLVVSRVMVGDTARLGLERPQLGPLELKNLSGKTPVLDVGTLARIKSGDVKVLSFTNYHEYHITFHSFALWQLSA